MPSKQQVLETCAECHWKYPDIGYLSPLMTSGGYTRPICGICALNLVNELHGVKHKRFRGEMAEQHRLDAIEWRKKHPECKES